VTATLDPAILPDKATWCLATNLPRPDGPRVSESPHPPADLAELVRLYGQRHWAEQGYKQDKDEVGWADLQVHSDLAIRRHQTLVLCPFTFCWATWFTDPPEPASPPGPDPDHNLERGQPSDIPATATRPIATTHTQPAPHPAQRPQPADPAIALTHWWKARS
jgi:hypothetical protein